MLGESGMVSLKPGDRFFFINLNSLDNWRCCERLIVSSTVKSINRAGYIFDTNVRYFRPEDCYSTQEDAIAALALWIEEQRVMLDEIRSEVEELRKSRG